MSNYVKISYKTQNINSALKACIMFIGKYYGKNNDDTYKSGKAFLAKKVKGASKTSIHKMVYPRHINDSKMLQWSFKKCSYDRAYRYIIYKMLQSKENRDEALFLLNSLYEEMSKDNSAVKILSNILVSEQRDLLGFASDKPQYASSKKVIQKILTAYNDCDYSYNCYLK